MGAPVALSSWDRLVCRYSVITDELDHRWSLITGDVWSPVKFGHWWRLVTGGICSPVLFGHRWSSVSGDVRLPTEFGHRWILLSTDALQSSMPLESLVVPPRLSHLQTPRFSISCNLIYFLYEPKYMYKINSLPQGNYYNPRLVFLLYTPKWMSRRTVNHYLTETWPHKQNIYDLCFNFWPQYVPYHWTRNLKIPKVTSKNLSFRLTPDRHLSSSL